MPRAKTYIYIYLQIQFASKYGRFYFETCDEMDAIMRKRVNLEVSSKCKAFIILADDFRTE